MAINLNIQKITLNLVFQLIDPYLMFVCRILIDRHLKIREEEQPFVFWMATYGATLMPCSLKDNSVEFLRIYDINFIVTILFININIYFYVLLQ